MNRQLFCQALIVVALLFPFHLKCQTFDEDVVQLKNGNVVHGIIIERAPGQSIKIQTAE